MTKLAIHPTLFSPQHAAEYLDISRSHFDAHIACLLPPPLDLRAPGSKQPMPRHRRDDLDSFARGT